MKTFTIGFTRISAEHFFGVIRENRIARIVDVRLNNASQLAGFAKNGDLAFFLKELCGADYVHLDELAPTRDILNAYRNGEIGWRQYEARFLDLVARRNIERTVDPGLLENGCLLCSEHEPHFCHRRLVAEYLNACWDTEIDIVHLQ